MGLDQVNHIQTCTAFIPFICYQPYSTFHKILIMLKIIVYILLGGVGHCYTWHVEVSIGNVYSLNYFDLKKLMVCPCQMLKNGPKGRKR